MGRHSRKYTYVFTPIHLSDTWPLWDMGGILALVGVLGGAGVWSALLAGFVWPFLGVVVVGANRLGYPMLSRQCREAARARRI